MPKIRILPHDSACPGGAEFEGAPGARLCDLLAANGVRLDQACGRAGVCATCHVLIRQGFGSLGAASDREEDQLGKAWGLEACSRLSCQVRLRDGDLVVEIPRYTLNLAAERRHSAP